MAWLKGNSQVSRVARRAVTALLTASALILFAAPADARSLHHQRHHARYAHAGHIARSGPAGVPSSPAFSAIVVDANSGRIVYAVDEDGLRHPASITKAMTLYLLFEQLDRGAMTLQSRIAISEHAAAQEPSKLGISPGETISVEDAIKAVVTRSANDIAVAIAEAIGHDESTFAGMMTRKAHALGMVNTTYRNASGLPNDQQITTAHDLTILARSLEDRFPRYFKYFATEEFDYDGRTIGNHNHLLGRIDGVDGIKTGYTRASGFNLLTSVHRDGRSLIAVVMGGRTAAARDRVMENLIDDHLAQCSTVRTATRMADATPSEDAAAPAVQRAEVARPRPVAVAANVPTHLRSASAPEAQDGEGDEADDEPTLRVSAVQVPVQRHSAVAAPVPPRPVAERTGPATRVPEAIPAPKKPTPAELGWTKGADAARPAHGPASPKPPFKPKGDANGRPAAKTSSETTVAARSSDASDEAAPAAAKGWKIQIGATDDAAKATALLDKARLHERSVLGGAKPVTEKVRRDGAAYYRAQFAGLDSASAETACRSLKRSGFSCFATRD